MGAAGWRVRADAFAIRAAALDVLIVIMGNAHEHADVSAFFKVQHLPRILDGFPRRLQQEPLLWIDVRSLAGRNPEELRIELIDLIEESTTLGDGLAGQAGFRVVKAFHIPAVGGNFGHGIAPFLEQFPERFGVIDTTWKAATDSDNCDVLPANFSLVYV